MKPKIRILIAEDFPIIRSNFIQMVNQCDDMEVVGTAATGKEIVELARTVPADIILMDMEMEKINSGVEAAELIAKEDIDIDVIFLTIHETDDFIFSALSCGAVDYIVKTEPNDIILEHIRNAYNGAPSLAPQIQNRVRTEFSRLKRSEQSLLYFVNNITSLTPAEKDLIHLLLENKKVSEIAQIRSVEVVTVKTQIQGLLRKFQCKRTKDIVQMLRELGLEKLF